MNTFSEQIRFFRKNKGYSQLDLAVETGVSSKHISFIETGRSKPSKGMILRIAEALGLPFRNQNELLSLAGFSDHFTRTPLDKNAMERMNKTLAIILEKQEPYPATVLDWNWDIAMHNKGFEALVQRVRKVYPEFSQSINIAELVFAADGFRLCVENWEEVAHSTVERLLYEQRESPGRHAKLIQALRDNPEIPEYFFLPSAKTHTDPFVYIDVCLGEMKLKFLTTLTSFGTPIDITASEILIEQYYPADDATEMILKKGWV